MKNPLYLKDCLKELNKEKYSLPIILGKDSNNDIHIKDLKELKNILISGSTHSGKSVFLNNVINTILLTKTPKEVQIILIDFKQAELYIYENIPHLKYPVIYDVEQAVYTLADIYTEREENKDKSYPDIVILLEDYADFLSLERIHSNVFQDLRHWVMHILNNGNNLGIYTILSSSKVADNEFLKRIRESIPNRLVGFLPTSQDSTTVLGEQGAEELMGSGDMIFKNMDTNEKIRVQTPFISTEETEEIIKNIS
ncbi:MAG: FtsK/SpoIIIE domain-containing protein [Candidatus Dojkabacteria bacterium]|jgi:S-DNA-T family DNA segregation ATPase FtsK/SpoIIIE|nr:FtsK/SpoIIIE domain-containing protein [Candidatus Dojkabacteria bacterium]